MSNDAVALQLLLHGSLIIHDGIKWQWGCVQHYYCNSSADWLFSQMVLANNNTAANWINRLFFRLSRSCWKWVCRSTKVCRESSTRKLRLGERRAAVDMLSPCGQGAIFCRSPAPACRTLRITRYIKQGQLWMILTVILQINFGNINVHKWCEYFYLM